MTRWSEYGKKVDLRSNKMITGSGLQHLNQVGNETLVYMHGTRRRAEPAPFLVRMVHAE